jgi:hypothetical protein
MFQSTISKIALCAAGGAVAAMTAAGPAAAVAAPALPDGGGKVHKGWTKDDTDVRKWPSSYAPVLYTIDEHRVVLLKCKVRKDGDTWYKLAKRHGWVNSDTVHVRSHVPHCRHRGGMPDGSMNDSARNDASANDSGRDDASMYPAPVGRTAGEPLG